jgi:CHAT domain-containing protein
MANNGTMSGEDGDPALPMLRHAQAEVERIAAIWPGQDVVMRLGADSFIAVPGEPDLERFDVIHIATHAQLFEGLPEHSTLRLAAGPGGVPISVSWIAELVLRAELVYLSCCETARSVSGSGALDSFAGACLRAGARSVIASTQRIDDEAAAEFAVLFYRHWLGGKSGAAALRAAQLELRAARPAWHHPYFWASYRLIGEGS